MKRTKLEKKQNVQRPTTEEILRILHKWGIHTLGQFAALEEEELRARLGPEAARLWERATGRSTRLLKFVQPPESFEESFEFENEIQTAEPLFFMLRRFLEQLVLRLSSIYLVAKELTLQVTFTNRQSYERVFKIPQPTNDIDLLFRMLQTHLENFKSKDPIVAVALTAQPIRPASRQFGLFERSLRNPHQLYETLSRLTALLGTDCVGTPVLENTHQPDAFRMEPFSWHGLLSEQWAPASWRPAHEMPDRLGPSARMPMPQPALRRLRPPVNTSMFVSEARYLQSNKIRGRIVDERGPYSLSGNWWDEKSWARAEWDLQLENGILCRCYQSSDTWKIDGIYD
jgi:impB/mucB/samB family C-terminal domain